MGKTSIHLILSWLAVWACAARAEEGVLLDFDMQTPPPPDWAVQGYAFGVHDQEPEYRQRAAVASRNQRQYQTGRIISPQFIIDDDFLLLPVGALAGTPLQTVTVQIDGRNVLEVDLPLAFGSIPVVGYLPAYDLTGHQGQPLKISFHSYTSHDPTQASIESQFYVSNTACTPSRSALMTGTHAHRIGMDGSVVFPGEKRGLNPKEITIAEMLKERGYATGCRGGSRSDKSPDRNRWQ